MGGCKLALTRRLLADCIRRRRSGTSCPNDRRSYSPLKHCVRLQSTPSATTTDLLLRRWRATAFDSVQTKRKRRRLGLPPTLNARLATSHEPKLSTHSQSLVVSCSQVDRTHRTNAKVLKKSQFCRRRCPRSCPVSPTGRDPRQ